MKTHEFAHGLFIDDTKRNPYLKTKDRISLCVFFLKTDLDWCGGSPSLPVVSEGAYDMPAINDGLSGILRPIDIARIQRLDIAAFPVFPECLVAYAQLGAYTFDGIDPVRVACRFHFSHKH